MEIDKDIPNILKLVDENLIVKVIAPSGAGKSTNLPKLLAKKYKTTVVVSDNSFYNTLNFPNVTYVLAKDYKKLNFKDMELLIVDELDGDSFYNFMTISIWKKSSSKVKLLLTSNSPHYLFPQFPTYEVKRYLNAPVDIRYLPNFFSPSSEKNISNFSSEKNIKNITDLIYDCHNSTIEGDFLVFAWGDKSVEKIINSLQNVNMDVEIINARNKKDIYKKTNKRKIIVTPKQLVSLDNIGCIFDSMREKRIEPTLSGGYRNKLHFISQREAHLRAYRSRIPCIVYRMISKKEYQELPESTPEKIFRIPLHHLMIDIYSDGFDPFEILFNFEKEEINFINRLFLNHGILDINRKITEKGKVIRKMNLGLRLSLLVVENLSYPSMVLASLIDTYASPIYLFPEFENRTDYKIDTEKHISTYFNRFRSDSDIETLLYIWETYKEESISLESMKKKENLEEWASKNYIDYNYLKEVNICLKKLKKLFPSVNEERFIVKDYISNIDKYLKNLYKDRIFHLDTERTIFAQYYNETTPYKIDVFAINDIEKLRPLRIYGLIFSSSETLNTISISYVSPETERQTFEEKEFSY